MKHQMTPYLQAIWNRLVRSYRLKNTDDGVVRVLRRDVETTRSGGLKRFTVTICRYELSHYRELGYIDFQEQVVVRRFRDGKLTREDVEEIPQHLTVNGSGTIRRFYRHQGTAVRAVRSISLRNYYMAGDAQVARLIMVTDDGLAWLHELPVTYYPISNNEFRTLTSVEALLEYYIGPGVPIPTRLRRALPLNDLIKLTQIVPGEYLNALSDTLKKHAEFVGDRVQVPRLILAYYRGRLADPDSQLFRVVYSYISACRFTETKLNMRIRSRQRLVEERAAVWRKCGRRRCPEFRTHKDLILPQQDYGDVYLDLICNRRQLDQEAKTMMSCVDTYALDIADGSCAIYHVRYRKKHYTLELRLGSKSRPIMNQLLGVRNAPAPAGLEAKIGKMLKLPSNADFNVGCNA